MLSEESAEGHDLVMLALNQKHPNPLSFSNQSLVSILLMSGPCIHNAPGKKRQPSFPALL